MLVRLMTASLVVLVLATTHGTSHAQVQNRSKKSAIQEMFRLTGVERNMDSQLRHTLSLMLNEQWKRVKKVHPEAPDDLAQLIENELLKAFMETKPKFLAAAVEIYSKRFTIAEIEEINAFYRTTVGKKLLRLMPDLMREFTTAGFYWGRDVAAPLAQKKVRELLRQKGFAL